jgi:hypothetical protein
VPHGTPSAVPRNAAVSFREPTAMYLRTGCGWTGRATKGGITWSPLIPK